MFIVKLEREQKETELDSLVLEGTIASNPVIVMVEMKLSLT